MTTAFSNMKRPRTNARAGGMLVAQVTLAGLIWFDETILLCVLGATTRAEVMDVRERIVYGVDTQARHSLEIDLHYAAGKAGVAAATIGLRLPPWPRNVRNHSSAPMPLCFELR